MALNLKIENIHNSRGIGHNYTVSSILSNNYLISNLDLIYKLNLASDQLRMTTMMVLMLKIMKIIKIMIMMIMMMMMMMM